LALTKEADCRSRRAHHVFVKVVLTQTPFTMIFSYILRAHIFRAQQLWEDELNFGDEEVGRLRELRENVWRLH
jgi:hypothetical protein